MPEEAYSPLKTGNWCKKVTKNSKTPEDTMHVEQALLCTDMLVTASCSSAETECSCRRFGQDQISALLIPSAQVYAYSTVWLCTWTLALTGTSPSIASRWFRQINFPLCWLVSLKPRLSRRSFVCYNIAMP